MSKKENLRLSSILIRWYEENKRDLPWRDTVDPYIIWISEVILQQTRVDQGLSYFNRFIQRFPAVRDLAEAGEDDVLKLWQGGLGYYSRARNLQAAARMIMDEFNGIFPAGYKDVLSLKGVGGSIRQRLSFRFPTINPMQWSMAMCTGFSPVYLLSIPR